MEINEFKREEKDQIEHDSSVDECKIDSLDKQNNQVVSDNLHPVISARNASYWLSRAVKVRSSSDLDIDVLPSSLVVTEEVYENQRYQPVLGWGSRGRLLPLDPTKFSDRLGLESWIVFPTIRVPDTTEKGSWEWITPWHIDYKLTECDAEGWFYGTSFTSMKSGTTIGAMQGNTFVRRRLWIRKRKFVKAGEPSAGAFDESHLDCVAGWLWKLGHRRKNWKKRFFVLEGSTLKYFGDSSRVHFKGEVLLFKEETKVRYVDIHVSGRDNTFIIEAGTYSLLLQAQSIEEREDWIYAIEDALLCRDSYANDSATRRRRDNVSRRRTISKDILCLRSSLSDLSPLPCRKDNLMKLLSTQASVIALEVITKAYDASCYNRFIRAFQSRQKYLTSGIIQAKEGLKQYRDHTETMLSEVLERFCDTIHSGNPGGDAELWALVVRDAILHEIERNTFIPLQDIIYQLLELSVDSVKYHAFHKKKVWLSQQNEAFFEIQDCYCSLAKWESSSLVFASLDNFSLPSEKANLLVEVARSIYDSANYSEESKQYSMAADDFLPIFIYVICKSDLRDLFITTELISSTMIHSLGVGETGYYVTMLEAAVEYIASFTMHQLNVEEK